jgi:uncharacterized protein (DUF362 family)
LLFAGLHELGISPSIPDVNATVKPSLAIVDGIVGMEGGGSITGTARRAGVLIVDTNAATDATATRPIGGDPEDIDDLEVASGRLGRIREHHIEQRVEPIARVVTRSQFPRAGEVTTRFSLES